MTLKFTLPFLWVLLGSVGSFGCGSDPPVGGSVKVFREYSGQGAGPSASIHPPKSREELPLEHILFDFNRSWGGVIKSSRDLDKLKKSRPDWPGKQEATELEKSKINFSNRMLIVVTRTDMYVPAKITSVVRMTDSIEVHYVLPPLRGDIRPRADGVCTYVALEVKKTDLPIAFKIDRE